MQRMLKTDALLPITGKLLAIGLLVLIAFQLYHFPFSTVGLSIFYLAYLGLLIAFPAAWLIVLPAMIPILDLSPWTGRYLWTEFDHLVLLTIAVALWHGNYAFRLNDRSSISYKFILVLIAWQTLVLVRGLIPGYISEAGFLSTYLDSTSALRGSKGFWEALALFPVLIKASNQDINCYRKIGIGLLTGLCLCIASVVWERSVLIGLFDYSAQYRTTGLFSGMHIGGAFLDAYLALSIPFFALSFIWSKHWVFRLFGLALFAGALYTFIVTFSRANYIALLIILGTMFIAPQLIRGRVTSFTSRKTLIALITVAGIVVTPIITGNFSKERLSHVAEDLKTRLSHWQTATKVMTDGPMSVLIGEGKGRFPAYYRARIPEGSLLASADLLHEADNSFVRFSPSDDSGDLYVRQRFSNIPQGPFQLKLNLRSWNQTPEKLLVEICERNILRSSPECSWRGIKLSQEERGEWGAYQTVIDTDHTKASRLWWARPIEISLLNRGIGTPIDIDNVELLDAHGTNLLSNSSFSNGSDNWFVSAGNHLSWHVKNIWVSAYFEGGILGLIAFILVLLFMIVRLKNNAQKGSKVSLLLLCGLGGFLVIGIFDNVFDDPRISFLFYLVMWLCFVKPDQSTTEKIALDVPWGTLFVGTSMAVIVFAAASFFYLLNSYQLTPKQLMLKGTNALGVQSEMITQILAPPQKYRDTPLDGTLANQHPRILLPQLRHQDALKRQQLIKSRIQQYQSNGIDYLSSCGASDLLFETVCLLSQGKRQLPNSLVNKMVGFKLVSPKPQGTYGNIWQLALAYDLLAEHFEGRTRERISINASLREGLKQTLLELDKSNAAAWHGRVSLAATAWITAVALDGSDKDLRSLRQRAQGHFLEAIAILETTEAWPEGYNYWIQNRAMLLALAGAAYSNGLEQSTEAQRVKSALAKVAHWSIYATRPDNRVEGLGDEGSRVDLKDETRRFIDLVAQINQDPVLAGYSVYLQRLHRAESYYRSYRWGFLLFNDPSIAPVGDGTLESLSPYLSNFKLFGRHAMNLGYIRNGWGPEDTFISFKAGHIFSQHGHYDAGHFSIYKGAPLAINSSTYGNFTSPNRLNYSIRSVAKNTLLIMRPNEHIASLDSEVSDGGQRVVLPTSNSISNLERWTQNYREGMHLEGGELLDQQTHIDSFSYLSFDLTGAYNNKEYDENNLGGKIRKVSRQFLYLHDEDRLLIYDYINSTSPGYTKKWLLHAMNKPILESAQVLLGESNNGILESSEKDVLIENEKGYLTVNRILPRSGKTRLIGGKDFQYYVENDGDDRDLNGENHSSGSKQSPWFDNGKWRIEFQPSTQQLEDRFLVVLSPSIDQPAKGKIQELQTSHKKVTGVMTSESATLFLPTGFKDYPIDFKLNKPLHRLRIISTSRRDQIAVSCSKSQPLSTGSVTEYALNFSEIDTHKEVSCSIFAK
ncbi:MAG: heparinase II/III-family protein [Motiliproteus sp.]|nr:heparinase II/III-family protein [Motiliproteus sp.]MCW9052569.1 heparinase II/III-family protein [Motiliproteus sp.]